MYFFMFISLLGCSIDPLDLVNKIYWGICIFLSMNFQENSVVGRLMLAGIIKHDSN